jgi:Histidinol dehydrogenase
MTITYLKKSPKTSSTDDTKTRKIVEDILKDIEQSKEEGCKEYSKKLDKYEGDVVVTKEKIEEIKKNLDQKTKDDIQFSHERVRKFAEAQLKIMDKILKLNYLMDYLLDKTNSCYTAGCMCSRRYAHIASAV